MNRPSPRIAIVFVPFCAGLGLLALLFAQAETNSPATLPPPEFSTRLPPPPQALATPLADSPAITIAANPYRHPSGAFSVLYPDGWQIDESEDSAQFTAPDDAGQFSVTFALTGAVTGSASNGDYESGLRTTWGDLPAFSIDEIDPAGTPDRWSAAFSFDQTLIPDRDTVRIVGFTLCLPRQGVLYQFTALMQSDFRESLLPVFQSIANSLQTDPNSALANPE